MKSLDEQIEYMRKEVLWHELVAEYEKDPELKAALEKARSDMARLKERLGEAAYREWLLGNFVNVEEIRRDA